MSRLEKLKKTTSLSELAQVLGYKPRAVSYILSVVSGYKSNKFNWLQDSLS